MTADKTFEFDLIFALPEGHADEDAILDDLFNAGFDDAAVGIGASGMIGLSLTRSGADAEAVISDAAERAANALPKGSMLREVKPDLVSLADVAARLNVSRQALQKRKMPAPSLGGLYRASEMMPYLEMPPGKVRDALKGAHYWFAAASGAQAVNAKLSLGTSHSVEKKLRA